MGYAPRPLPKSRRTQYKRIFRSSNKYWSTIARSLAETAYSSIRRRCWYQHLTSTWHEGALCRIPRNASQLGGSHHIPTRPLSCTAHHHGTYRFAPPPTIYGDARAATVNCTKPPHSHSCRLFRTDVNAGCHAVSGKPRIAGFGSSGES